MRLWFRTGFSKPMLNGADVPVSVGAIITAS